MSDLVVDHELHRYLHDGRQLFNPHRVLDACGMGLSKRITPEALRRGQALHKACQLLIEQDLDMDSVHPSLRPKLAGFARFLTEVDFEPEGIETAIHSHIYPLAGTPDLWGRLEGKKVLIDIKSGAVAPWVTLQLGAYETCLGEPHDWFVLQLKDEDYRLLPVKDKRDKQVFLSMLAEVCWRQDHGYLD